MVEILRISKIKSRRDLLRHSQLPTPNSKLLDKFQFIRLSAAPGPPRVDIFGPFGYTV